VSTLNNVVLPAFGLPISAMVKPPTAPVLNRLRSWHSLEFGAGKKEGGIGMPCSSRRTLAAFPNKFRQMQPGKAADNDIVTSGQHPLLRRCLGGPEYFAPGGRRSQGASPIRGQ